MFELIRTNAENSDFQILVSQLDALLKQLDGEDHMFYAQLNKSDEIKHVLVAYKNHKAVGCGALRSYSEGSIEIKRMFTLPESRGKGIASMILSGLESWAKELGYRKCILETGLNQTAAIALYKKSKYIIISNYGKYENMENSVCFEKELL